MRPQISEEAKPFSLHFLMFNIFIFYGLCRTQLLKAGRTQGSTPDKTSPAAYAATPSGGRSEGERTPSGL